MARRHKSMRRSSGGTARKGVEVYAGAGSNVAHEAESQDDVFAHGGHLKRHHAKRYKRGGRTHEIGKAAGAKPRARADRRPRSRAVPNMNNQPFASAATGPDDYGNDVMTPDTEMPMKRGGRAHRPAQHIDVYETHGGKHQWYDAGEDQKFAHGGRPHPLKNHHPHYNYAHSGAGHEEPIEHHPPALHNGVPLRKRSKRHKHTYADDKYDSE